MANKMWTPKTKLGKEIEQRAIRIASRDGIKWDEIGSPSVRDAFRFHAAQQMGYKVKPSSRVPA